MIYLCTLVVHWIGYITNHACLHPSKKKTLSFLLFIPPVQSVTTLQTTIADPTNLYCTCVLLSAQAANIALLSQPTSGSGHQSWPEHSSQLS